MPGREARTYRVRQLPAYLRYHRQVANLLAGIVEDLGSPEDIRVFSLATSLNPLEIPPTKVATLMFNVVPPRFDNDHDEWVISGQSIGLLRDIVVDVHFLDFTPLNDVSPDDHTVDCIAVSGLASHPFGSWKQRTSSTDFMWLRDRLPKDLPNVRSIIYGYDTHLIRSESVKGIDDIAVAFIGKMKSIGRSSPSAKALVILAHSLGGIVVKQAVTLMANTKDSSNVMVDLIRGVIFFGVPNKGMATSHLLSMVEDQPNDRIIHHLSPDSDFLPDLDRRFSGIATHRDMKMMSVYETKRSATTQMSPTGRWERNGPPKLLVDKLSAIQRKSDQIMAIDEDHSNLVKFGADDPDCRVIIDYVHDIAKDAERPVSTKPRTAMAAGRSLGDEKADFEEMRSSLNLVETGHRLDEIEKQYTHTFEWIFDNDELGFVSWLKDESDIYWVSGKPGSGKSTLMRLIRGDPRIDHSLRRCRVDATYHIIDFFFHDRGSSMQKSLEGLLYRILYQLISAETELGMLILPSYRRRPKSVRHSWSIYELRRALDVILEQKEIPVRVLLFLDALDEFNGKPETVVDFIKDLVKVRANSQTKLKICCSSREWNIFEDSFNTTAGVKIHKYTQEDILKYVDGRLHNNTRMNQLTAHDSTDGTMIDALRRELCRRAEGVFVWVRIVMNELLKACTDGASPSELISILSSFPDGLDELYERLIDRIDQQYKRESYAFIEIVLRSKDSLGLRDLGLVVQCALGDTPSSAAARLPSDPYSEEFLESTRRRLKSRCGGLLEVLPDTTVQFMHQTAKEFFSRPGSTKSLLHHEPSLLKENGFSFLAKFWLTLASAPSRPFDWLAYILTMSGSSMPGAHYIPGVHHEVHHHAAWSQPWELQGSESQNIRTSHSSAHPAGFSVPFSQERCLEYAYLAEVSTGRSQRAFIEQIPDRALFNFFLDLEDLDYYIEDPLESALINSRLSFAAIANLRLFMAEALGAYHCVNANPGRSLLHRLAEYTFRNLGPERGIWPGPTPMAQILLDFGADAGQRDRLVAPWRPRPTVGAGLISAVPFQVLFLGNSWETMTEYQISFAETLLRYGQDPNVDIVYPSTATKYEAREKRCKPLHLAPDALAQTLLSSGADVNALDSFGLTPLDATMRDLAPSKSQLKSSRDHDICENKIRVLLKYGGHLNKVRGGDRLYLIKQLRDSSLGPCLLTVPCLQNQHPRRQYHDQG